MAAEVDRQLETFRRLVGTGPTHIDSHQHVHRDEPVRSVVLARAGQLGVPVRHCNPRIQYCGDFYGQTEDGRSQPAAISVTRLVEILNGLPPGLTELCCHPAEGDDLNTLYRTERVLELATLCDPRVRQAIANLGIQLRSFQGF